MTLPPDPATRFSIERAAFAGFRLAGREPRLVLALALIAFVLGTVVTAATVAAVGPVMMQLQAVDRATAPAAVLGMIARLAPVQALATAASLAAYAVMIAAVCRALLRPREAGFARLRVGADEARQFLLLLLLAALALALYVALAVGATLSAIVLGVMLAVAGVPAESSAAWLAVVAILGVVAALVVAAVRLSLASPHAFASGRTDLLAVWRMTHGRFWALLGAYLLAGLMLAVVALAFAVAEAAVALAVGGGPGGLQAMFRPDLSSLAAYFTPLQVAAAAMGSLVSGLAAAVIFGAQADAYAQLAGVDAQTAAADSSRSVRFGTV